jgi:hypothetical protein
MKSRKLKMLICRFLACVVLGFFALSLSGDVSGSQSACCKQCQQRFDNCDSPDFICCQIYNGCIQQCGGGCSPMNCDLE